MRPALVVAAAVAAGTLFAPAAPHPAGAAPTADSGCEEPEPTRSYDEDSLDYSLALDLSGCDWWEGGQIELTATLTRFSLLDDATTVTNRLCGVPAATTRPARDRSGGRGGRDAGAEDPADETPADETPADDAPADDAPADDAPAGDAPSEDDMVEEAPAGDPRTDKPEREPDEGDEEESDPRYERARAAKCVIDAQLEHPQVETAIYSGEITYPWEDGTHTVSFSALCTASPLGQRCTDLP